MDIESVKALFELFSSEKAEEHAPIITLSIVEVDDMILPGADTTDVRLNFLAAALANYRLSRIKASRDRTKVTYAGKILTDGSDSPCGSAAVLLREYMQLCKGLIREETFMFAGFSGGEDIC